MTINADFSQRVVVHGDEMTWQASPIAGIQRKMFDRIGDEVARATSLVRYDPETQFSPHVHTGGEEFIVLEGLFQDEYGDYPAGSYVRNPPLSKHTPGSKSGCLIFVKLWQFDLSSRTHLRLNMNTIKAEPVFGRPGVSVIPLHSDSREDVRLEIWQPGAQVSIDTNGGAEVLVLKGSIKQGGENLRYLSWLRMPLGSQLIAKAGPIGAQVWVKTNHLQYVDT